VAIAGSLITAAHVWAIQCYKLVWSGPMLGRVGSNTHFKLYFQLTTSAEFGKLVSWGWVKIQETDIKPQEHSV